MVPWLRLDHSTLRVSVAQQCLLQLHLRPGKRPLCGALLDDLCCWAHACLYDGDVALASGFTQPGTRIFVATYKQLMCADVPM